MSKENPEQSVMEQVAPENDVKVDAITEEEEPEPVMDEGEHFKLGGRPPFKTICALTVGPLLSQLCQSTYGLVDSFWISRSIGVEGMTVMSLVLVVDFINIAFAQYFSVAMSARISYLFGIHQKDQCAQVVVDLLRVAILVGILIPAVLLPLAKPLVKWFGASPDIADMCLDYCLPAFCCSMVNYTYMSLCGLLQAMGNSGIYGICHLTSACLNMFVFDPIFLLVIKSGMWGVSTATMCSILLPMLTIYICLFKGKFAVKPTFSMYLNKFNPHAFKAMKVSLSQLIANLATSLPVLMLAKLVSSAGQKCGMYVETMAAWNIQDRLYQFSISVCNALNQGFLPAASYAFGSNRYNRLLRLAIYSVLLGTAWTTLCTILITTLPKQFARIWEHDEAAVDLCARMLVIGFCTCWLNQAVYTMTAALQAMKMVVLSIVTSLLVFLIPIPIFGCALYFTKDDDPPRLIFSFVGHDIWAFLVVATIAAWKLRFLFKEKASGDGDMTRDSSETNLKTGNEEEDTTNEIISEL